MGCVKGLSSFKESLVDSAGRVLCCEIGVMSRFKVIRLDADDEMGDVGMASPLFGRETLLNWYKSMCCLCSLV